MNTRIVFMGSPDFALPALRGLAAQYQVSGVVTQPDRPAGRGQKLVPPPVKELAVALGIPCIQPEKVRSPEAMAQLAAWAPDLIVVAAFGQILRPNLLDLPRWGCVNVHASLLPRWRGAAPIQAAILHGDLETGITIMRMDPGMDTGPILSQRSLTISPQDTAGTLSERLAVLGADLLLETLPGYLEGTVAPQAQDSSQVTLAPLLKKEDGLLDFNRPAEALERQVRAMQPWPGAFMLWQGEPLKVLQAAVVRDRENPEQNRRPGQKTTARGFPAVQTPQDALALIQVQPAGKRPMPGDGFLRGARGWQE
jgi:methionyl-tRNA formyltransferase